LGGEKNLFFFKKKFEKKKFPPHPFPPFVQGNFGGPPLKLPPV